MPYTKLVIAFEKRVALVEIRNRIKGYDIWCDTYLALKELPVKRAASLALKLKELQLFSAEVK